MTGTRIGTLPSSDLALDVYGTLTTSTKPAKVKLLTGVRLKQGTWTIQVKKLSAIGLPTSGSVVIQTYGFPVGSDVHYSEVDAPQNLGTYSHDYSGDVLSFPVYNTDVNRAYAFEFVGAS